MSDCFCDGVCNQGDVGGGGISVSPGADWQKKVFEHAKFDVAERSRRIVHMSTLCASMGRLSGCVIVPARLRDLSARR